jgi:hypothetical protein
MHVKMLRQPVHAQLTHHWRGVAAEAEEPVLWLEGALLTLAQRLLGGQEALEALRAGNGQGE